MQLVVPLLLRNMSEEQLGAIIGQYASEFGLKPDYSFAKGAIMHRKQWSTEELARYAKERAAEGGQGQA